MIVKMADSVEGVVYALPAVAEFGRRFPDEPIMVETILPELVSGLPRIDGVGKFFDLPQRVARLDEVDVRFNGHLVDAYAMAFLGDSRLGVRRVPIRLREEDRADARKKRNPGRKLVAATSRIVCLLGDGFKECGCDVAELSESYLAGDGPAVVSVIGEADLYVGLDGPISALASMTDTPMVVVHSWRDPRHTRPLRRGVPFEAVVPGLRCQHACYCMSVNASGEFCHIYHVKCQSEDRFACERFDADEVWKASRRMLDRCAPKS